jgi:hypothetical protein
LAVIPRRRAAGVGELENRRHGARVGVNHAADGDQLAVFAGLDDEGLGETIDGKRSAARRSQPADLAFRHARFQPQPAGVGDMEQGYALGDEGAGRHRDIGQRAGNRCADCDAARSPQLSLPRLGRIGLGFGHALVGAGFEQAPFSDGFVLEQRFHALAFAPRLLQPDARLAGGGLQRRLIGFATETRRQIRQHLALVHRLADAREAACRPQHAGRRRGQQRLAIRLRLYRRRGGDRRTRRALDRLDRGEVDLPLLLLGEGDAAAVCMVAVVCGGGLGIRENLHRAELVRHAAVRRLDDQRQLALAAGLGCHVRLEDAGLRPVRRRRSAPRARCRPDSRTVSLPCASGLKSASQVSDARRRLAGVADDERRKLDKQFRLVAEVGELFAASGPWSPVGVAGGLCGGDGRRHRWRAVFSAQREKQCDDPARSVVDGVFIAGGFLSIGRVRCALRAGFPFEVEGGQFSFQRPLVGVEQFEHGGFAGAVGGLGDAQQFGRWRDSLGTVARGGGDQLRRLAMQAEQLAFGLLSRQRRVRPARLRLRRASPVRWPVAGRTAAG